VCDLYNPILATTKAKEYNI